MYMWRKLTWMSPPKPSDVRWDVHVTQVNMNVNIPTPKPSDVTWDVHVTNETCVFSIVAKPLARFPPLAKTCLDYVWSVNVFMLSVWAILPVQVSLPSWVEVVSLLHNWIRSPSRPLKKDHVDLVCVSVQLWSPGLHFGVLIWVIFWSLFRVPFLGTVLGPYNYKENQGPQNGAQKWNPKQGPKLDPNQTPKCNPGPHICTETQTRISNVNGGLGKCWRLWHRERESSCWLLLCFLWRCFAPFTWFVVVKCLDPPLGSLFRFTCRTATLDCCVKFRDCNALFVVVIRNIGKILWIGMLLWK